MRGIVLLTAFLSIVPLTLWGETAAESVPPTVATPGPGKATTPTAGRCPDGLPASGQTTSYGTGSDGDRRAGHPLQYRDNGDGTISDLGTGLTWEKKADYDNADVNCTSTAICPNPHDADNRYLWSGGGERFDGPIVTVFLEQLNARCSNDPGVSCHTDADCRVPGGPCGFAGHRDWRIPNWKELLSIVDFESLAPSTSSAFNTACTASCSVKECSCTAPNVHWTSDTHLEDRTWGGYVSFYDGNLHADTKSHAFFVRAVRGGSPAAPAACGGSLPASGQTASYGPGSDGDVRAGKPLRYLDHGDGTVTDLTTSLMWEKKADYDNRYTDCTTAARCPDPHDADNRYSWGSGENLDGTVVSVFLEQLNNRCHDDPTVPCTGDAACSGAGGRCGFAGHRDWRLPNAKELQSIVSYERPRPAVGTAFNDICSPSCTTRTCSCTAPTDYWTSTTYQGDPSWAVFVGFFSGNVYAAPKSETRCVRAVRGGS